MKKFAAVFVLISLAIVLSACAGGADSGETSATPASAAATGTPPPVITETELEVPRDFEAKASTPEFFRDALKANEPLFVLFYGEDDVSQDVLAEVQSIHDHKNYSGVVKFLLMKIDDKQDITELARDFSVGYIPHIAVLDRGGQVTFEKRGYVDSEVLEQAVYNATNK